MKDVGFYFTFAEVVRTGSFTAAARALGVTKATVSKQVMHLENTLGLRLLHRTTRKLSPTTEGEALYVRCRRMAEELDIAKAEIMHLRSKPRGKLRVSVPMTFGLLHIVPAVPEFLDRYPEIEFDLQLDDRVVDLVENCFDVAVRIADLPDSSLTIRKLASSSRVVCATPEYLKRHGVPRKPEELRQHQCLKYTYLASGATWRMSNAKGEHPVHVSGPLQANSSLALKVAVLAHAGLAQFPTFVVIDELRSGRLVPVLEDYELPSLNIWAVHASGRTVTPKVRAWVDFLVRRFEKGTGWSDKPTSRGA
ncbi:MAG TPA: LysR family transcriptional regulator [Archangium sp.]|nr:LysR family transcriptional regulator [Archangium sp.]